MIIMGFPGIGKKTLIKHIRNTPTHALKGRLINLPIDNPTMNYLTAFPSWVIPYAKIAIELSEEGFIVLVSSNPKVVHSLMTLPHNEKIATIYPSLDLKHIWVQRLFDIWTYGSFNSAEERYQIANETSRTYEIDILNLENLKDRYHPVIKTVIQNTDYDLEAIITYLEQEGSQHDENQ